MVFVERKYEQILLLTFGLVLVINAILMYQAVEQAVTLLDKFDEYQCEAFIENYVDQFQFNITGVNASSNGFTEFFNKSR